MSRLSFFGVIHFNLAILLLLVSGLCQPELVAASDTEQLAENWLIQNYTEAIKRISKSPYMESNLWTEIEWRIACKVLPAHESEFEFFFYIQKHYSGSTNIIAIMPEKNSIKAQLRRLRSENASINLDELLTLVSVSTVNVSGNDHDISSLIRLIQEMTLPVIVGSDMYMDPACYIFVFEARGRKVEMSLIAPPFRNVKGEHPLIEWIDKFRASLERHF